MGELDTDQLLRAVAAAPSAAPALPTHVIGPYEIESLLGKGGMGAVYAARHSGTGRKVALKVIVPRYADSVDAVERFRREAKALGRLQHPHVVDVTDFGADRKQLYLAMEYLGGRSLRHELNERGALPLLEVVDIIEQIASALAAAHAVGIVHRDLKPENVQLVPAGAGRTHVKVLDFGIAKLSGMEEEPPPLPPDAATEPGFADPSAATTGAHALTKAGAAVGTPLYMAPEQILGEAVDARADVYALAALAWECLTGKPPRTGNAQALFVQHLERVPLHLSDARVARGVRGVIELGLSPKASERPDAALFAHHLRVVAAGADAVYAAASSGPDQGERVRAIVGFTVAIVGMAAIAPFLEPVRSPWISGITPLLLAPWLAGGAVALWVRRRARPWELVLGPVLASASGMALPKPFRPIVAALAFRSAFAALATIALLLWALFLTAFAVDVESAYEARVVRSGQAWEVFVATAALAAIPVGTLVLQGVLCVRFIRAVRLLTRPTALVPVEVARKARLPSWTRLAAFVAGTIALGALAGQAIFLRTLALGMSFVPMLLLELVASATPRDGIDPMSVAIEHNVDNFAVHELTALRAGSDETRHLLRALEKQDDDAMILLMRARVDPTARSNEGDSMLTLAARYQNSELRANIVKALIEEGAELDRPDADGTTPRARLHAIGDPRLERVLARTKAR